MKKRNVLLLSFTLLSILVNAQKSQKFKNLTDMGVARAGIATATDGNFIYVSCGFARSSYGTSMVEKYDIQNDSWSVLTNSLGAKRYASSVVVGNNLYVLNGTNRHAFNNKVEVVNLSNGSITNAAENPLPRRIGGIAAWNGCIYVFGGAIRADTLNGVIKHRYTDKLYKFDTSTQIWKELASMPEAKETQGEIINGKLYVLGGYSGKKVSNRIDVYDLNDDTWTSLGTLPDSLSAHATAAVGSKIYIVGDYTKLTTLACYDVSLHTYTTLKNNMIGRRHAGAEIVKDKLYIMGGNQASDNNTLLTGLQVTNLAQ